MSDLLTPPRLPIADHESLTKALREGDIPTLLMVLTNYERDEEFLDKFSGYIGSVFEPPKEIPETLKDELRARLFNVLTRNPAPVETPLPDDLMRKMLSTDVGEPVAEEFIPMLMEQMGFEKQQPRRNIPGRKLPPKDFKVLVIGAGLTGLLAGIKLGEAGYDYQIIEKNHDIGGTWLENIYPGAAVDTPSHFYSYSFELNPDWSHYTPTGPEFQQYLLNVTEKYQLRKNITFNTKVTDLIFDEASNKWRVTVEDSNGKRIIEANAVINAHGPVNRWSFPNIPGLKDFKGPYMHTAGWDPKVDLKGKRIAMFGTGASAAQLGPKVAPDAAHLTVFQRSKHWVMPNHFIEVPDAARWAMRYIPHYAEWFRFRAFWFAADGLFSNIQVDPNWPNKDVSVSAHNEAIRQYCLGNYEQKLANRPDLKEKLIPDYPVFSKRIVMDIGWLNMMVRDNVSLENAQVERVEPNGIRMKDGRLIEVDAILFATGFNIAKMIGNLHIVGRDGRDLGEEWGEDNPSSYLGVTVPGYPNYFLTVGPNSAPNHAGGQNIISETQINYIIECLDILIDRNAKVLEPTNAAYERWNNQVAEDLKGLIWSLPKAHSYYRNSKGRVFLSCPYRLVDYWKMTRKPKLEDFQIK
jgi:4-hydroxyacetophenone monooxygenase